MSRSTENHLGQGNAILGQTTQKWSADGVLKIRFHVQFLSEMVQYRIRSSFVYIAY